MSTAELLRLINEFQKTMNIALESLTNLHHKVDKINEHGCSRHRTPSGPITKAKSSGNCPDKG